MLSNYFLIASEIKKITWLLFIPKNPWKYIKE